MNFPNNILNLYSLYESWKERDQTYVKIYETGPLHKTNYFLRDGVDHQQGGRIGICGNKKDHRRVYLCQICYQRIKNDVLQLENQNKSNIIMRQTTQLQNQKAQETQKQ